MFEEILEFCTNYLDTIVEIAVLVRNEVVQSYWFTNTPRIGNRFGKRKIQKEANTNEHVSKMGPNTKVACPFATNIIVLVTRL